MDNVPIVHGTTKGQPRKITGRYAAVIVVTSVYRLRHRASATRPGH